MSCPRRQSRFSRGTWTRSRVLVASGRPGVVWLRTRSDWKRADPRRSTAASKGGHLVVLISEEMFDTAGQRAARRILFSLRVQFACKAPAAGRKPNLRKKIDERNGEMTRNGPSMRIINCSEPYSFVCNKNNLCHIPRIGSNGQPGALSYVTTVIMLCDVVLLLQTYQSSFNKEIK